MTDHYDDVPEWDTPEPRIHVTLDMQVQVLHLLRTFVSEHPDFAAELSDFARRCDDSHTWLEALLALLETWQQYVLASESRDITMHLLQADLEVASIAMLVDGPEALS